ncbi:M20 family metallopeptidase [Alkalihalobacillus pseudalcaliphilus]|uniref:M20 family metallopeptidase n=1 Tax=Alkalihalobacillus pseudalcaliphilus TaxID=79884 RepID=UPI00064DE39A|nr:M20 family metallopeptidase [Alkalihalobacillus pseudalcaliphilus]KMK76473.1 peptidase M20 [Alkalihalobacillus pseudalcaliphilus]
MIEKVLNFLREHEQEMIMIRRELHQYPELSFEEIETPKKIASYLENIGVEVHTEVGGRGVVGYIRGGKPGKTVALRADFDALPIQEETGLPFASTIPGKMHACGHDGHTASLLLVAKALMTYQEELEGTIVLIHQFAEELAPGGAIQMIKAGCLDGVDVIYGTHLWSPFEVGQIGYLEGPSMAAADRFEIVVQGRGGHGASPHETIDAITVGSQVVLSLQQIVSRNVDPLESAVITVASFHAGGPFNVIADTAQLVGTVRTFDNKIQDYIIERIEQVTKGVCEAMGASYSYLYKKGYPTVVNDVNATRQFVEGQESLFKDLSFTRMSPVMGGEDFSYYLERVPGTFFFTGAGNQQKGITYPHHHPKFDIDESALLHAAQLLASSALTYLLKHSIQSEDVLSGK